MLKVIGTEKRDTKNLLYTIYNFKVIMVV